MLYLFTGNPGEGKTLNALDFVIQEQEKNGEKRKVFYFNFQKFPDGSHFDKDHPEYDKVKDWEPLSKEDLTDDLWSLYEDQHPTIPHGSIILVDECQDLYPTRSRGDVPEHLKFFEKHRHTGCDFILVTQKIRQVDIHLRSLVGEHSDFKRVMGRDLVRVKTLPRVMEGKDEESDEIQTSQKKYPKKYFDLYKSASVHTHKKKLPKKLLLLPITVSLVAGLIYFAVQTLTNSTGAGSSDTSTTLSDPSAPDSLSDATLGEKIASFHPSLVSKRYRITYYDLADRVHITDEKSTYYISKKEQCRFHEIYGFVCVFDNKFLILRESYNDDKNKNAASPF
ncbi:MAG: zonular occludens toxin domain-containing protein [Hydrogenovibrio sp.]|uniref:zonular occludens toxin domain-containing protein n=1 Tax=Hydrogenovibrio sp. TaxID=2065821 RepID=UPI0028703B57|nr:zonular occludens toxin domain-containing protein [Hydrogenovibrio sp.]MDR9499799.1 zonular occludens toxin domain-containing protein [Hydrogenovibrio sp.]